MVPRSSPNRTTTTGVASNHLQAGAAGSHHTAIGGIVHSFGHSNFDHHDDHLAFNGIDGHLHAGLGFSHFDHDDHHLATVFVEHVETHPATIYFPYYYGYGYPYYGGYHSYDPYEADYPQPYGFGFHDYREPYRQVFYDADLYQPQLGVGDVADSYAQYPPQESASIANVQPTVEQLTVTFTTIVPGANATIDEGLAAFSADQYETARRAFVRAMLDNPDDPYARMLYGLTWFAQGNVDQASYAIHSALAQSTDVVTHPLDVAALYPDRGVLDQQLDQLATYLDRHPQDRSARFLLGLLYFTVEQPERALDLLSAVAADDGDDQVAALLVDTLNHLLANPSQ